MKKAFTVYIDDDDNVKALGITLCMSTDDNHNATTMVTREAGKWNALYVPHLGDVEFWEEPERKKGKWIDEGDPLTLRCSKCDYRVARYNNTNYCPNCGADMRSKIGGKHADFMMIDEAVVKGADDE